MKRTRLKRSAPLPRGSKLNQRAMKCVCEFGSLGPAAFGFCQRCSRKHDGGNGAAGAKFDAWMRKQQRANTTRTLPRGKRLRQVGKRGRAIRLAMKLARVIVQHRDGPNCRRCLKSDAGPLDLHHRRARSQGGSHTPENLVLLCRPCHSAVTDHTAKDWRKWVETRKAVRA